jgi:hypothetical protein
LKTSRNPKVLHYVIRNALEGIFKKISQLKEVEAWLRARLAEMKAKADSNMAVSDDHLRLYRKREKELRDRIDFQNLNLTNMIKAHLLDPNLAAGWEEPSDDTNYITDKALTALAYGFRKNESDYIIAGIANKGLAIGEDKSFQVEFDFINPKNHKFPAFFINDILKISNVDALIGSNNGLIELHILNGEYLKKTTRDGINTNQINKVGIVKDDLGLRTGYIVGTSRGLSFSPNGIRWLNVDTLFNEPVTAFHRTKETADIYSEIFIGTTHGVYHFNCNEYIQTGSSRVTALEGINKIIPSQYINSLSFDSDSGILYIATQRGVVLINDVKNYINTFNHAELIPDYRVVTVTQGLSNDMCFDILLHNGKIIIATANGLTITENFIEFSYITRKNEIAGITGVDNYMCNKLLRRTATAITVVHPVGFSKEIEI